jgi:asparagine synthase (glutamine-hydrolysing)
VPGFAAIFARDGAPISPARLHAMTMRLAYRGSACATWIDNDIGIAQVARPHPARPASVAASAQSPWHLALDGRIDNRTELTRALEIAPAAPDGSEDAGVMLAALDRWGADAAGRVLGEFACVAWHARDRQLWLLRDVMGLRPLYIRLTPTEVTCASDLQTLALDGHAELNEGVVAENLCGTMATSTETLYRGIERLPLAHVARISATGHERSQYWTPRLDEALPRRSPQARSDEFSAIFSEAVAARHAGLSGVALLLSGGLDSSSIAAELAASPRTNWSCYTLGLARAEEDESSVARHVAAHFGIPHVRVAAAPVDPGDIRQEIALSLDLPGLPSGIDGTRLRRRAVADGHGVALSGLGSDEWFGGSFLTYADLAARGALVELARTVWADRRRRLPTAVHLRIAAWALCPRTVQRHVRAVLGRSPVPPWIDAHFAARTALADRLAVRDIPIPDFPTRDQRAAWADTTSGDYAQTVEMQEFDNAVTGLDERYPFHDRRLIEFALSLPASDRWGRGVPKAVIRRAMAPRLPASVIDRVESPDANWTLRDILIGLGGRGFFETLEIAGAGWVNRAAVVHLWDRMQDSVVSRGHPGRHVWQLWAVASVELWRAQAAGR